MKQDDQEVTREDYRRLETIFTTYFHNAKIESPESEEYIQNFITDVGLEVKHFLQKYHNDAIIKKMEVDNLREQMQALKHKDVKRALSLKNVENAINKFKSC